jgi:hypothetical protein
MPAPPEKKREASLKHNYIILLDLSDRLILQDDQPQRDKEIVRTLYSMFEQKVKKELYVKSRDEIKVVMAPQRGSGLKRDVFEDRLYVNMENVDNVSKRGKEEERRKDFFANIDTLYAKAVFSRSPDDYHGADIWKYFYEDLRNDYVDDADTKNYLFIITDGYPIVGQNSNKLLEVKDEFPGLNIVMLEAAPRDRDMEWDRIMTVWEQWFSKIGIEHYTLIKRGSITKELEQIKEIVDTKEATLTKL